jgi:biotin carboxyl carrier protein
VSRRYRVSASGTELVADLTGDAEVAIDGRRYRLAPAGPGRYRVTAEDGTTRLVAVAGPAHAPWAVSQGHVVELAVDGSPHRASATRAADAGMTAPMPATVVKVLVAVGDRVEAGVPVVVLEAMKMELTVRASKRGVVRAVQCRAGAIVAPGVPLLEIDG